MNTIKLFVLSAIVVVSGCATTKVSVPKSWQEPIVPKVSLTHEVEYPWEALAIRHTEGEIFSVAMPEEWYRSQFPFVPVKDPESKEIIPLQRITSRVVLFCNDEWIRSSAVINRNGYDVLVPQSCEEGDRGIVVSGNGKYALTFNGEIVRDVQMEKLDTVYREEFFTSHNSVIHNLRSDPFPSEVMEHFNQIIVADGARYRIGDETLLAVMITVGSSIGERFLDCGGGDVNVISAVMVPSSIAIKAGVAMICAASGQPKGLFLSDNIKEAKK